MDEDERGAVASTQFQHIIEIVLMTFCINNAILLCFTFVTDRMLRYIL